MSAGTTFRLWRGDAGGGAFRDYVTEVAEGMVVLDAVRRTGGAPVGWRALRAEGRS